MAQPFSTKLEFLLKALSISRARLAADLRLDKSVVGRWVTGASRPSDHSLTALTTYLAIRIEGFTAIDWERSCESLAAMLGLDAAAVPGSRALQVAEALPMPLIDEILVTTARRADAYEGFYRATRPLASEPGLFVHDHVLIRKDASGILRLDIASGGVTVKCVLLPLQHQLFVVGAEQTSGALAFGILNGVNATKALTIDGLILNCALDLGRTPTATAVLLERIGDLDGDIDADDARFAAMAVPALPIPGRLIPDDVRRHLVRNIGPDPLAAGGDWLLRMPIARSMSRGGAAPPDGPEAAS